ncbi:terminase large subunit domain-containing protein [Campylobacter mucosalis]|uniref:Terminase domain protein n=1 Tax=Campylobacter mucosalis CCUG 21559 TaxID=1032067 RepID=A0A6G5QGG2_9BACT|nr:terminase family protein [Campylobacter mucosalis]QCD44110.1 terminase domain protein [Campylobacter mucosalis CCUG 21559]QCD44699.1 terminase domain protein [Campylobacter mucosalis CCUG 21559]
MINLSLQYTPQQKKVFFENTARFTTIEKGRRFGFTKGTANACIEWLLEGHKILWVDTMNANLKRYFQRYFYPELKQLPREMWSYNAQDKQLNLGEAWLDFRSAERPENIEGFGYDIVILNEAGIILKDSYLWDNAISPMLLDNPKSRAFIGGVPKGKNKFYELAQRGMKNESGWVNFQFSSYDNPLLNRDEIDRLVLELGGADSDVARQEIFGEFLDTTSNGVFNLAMIESAINRASLHEPSAKVVWGLDVARDGDDESVLCVRKGHNVQEFRSYRINSVTELARAIYGEYERAAEKPVAVFIDSVGVGAGAYDGLCDLGLRSVVREAKGSFKATNEKRYANKRAEMFFRLKDKFNLLSLPNNEKLKKQLQMINFTFDKQERYLILPKEIIKKEFGESPDFADSLALTFFDEILTIEKREAMDDDYGFW